MTRDCPHGRLARSCETCAAEAEIAELRAELEARKEADPAGIDGRLYHMACVAPETLDRFVGLVAEDCAKRCEEEAAKLDMSDSYAIAKAYGCDDCSSAIREAYKP